MKIAIINLSGNVGKTTLAKNMFAPLMSAQRIEIREVKDENMGDGEPDVEVTVAQFRKLAGELNLADESEHFVIDIGASNFRALIGRFIELKTTRDAIDYWVIPVINKDKVKKDSLATMARLTEIGVAASKIVLVMNDVEDVDSFDSDFEKIFDARKYGVHVAEQGILASDLYEILKDAKALDGSEETVFSLVKNSIDLKTLRQLASQARQSGNTEELEKLNHRSVMQNMAEMASSNLLAVFESTPIGAEFASMNTPLVEDHQPSHVSKAKKDKVGA